MFRTSPQTQIEIERLTEALRSVSTGQMVSYKELTSAIGRDVQKQARLSLIQARKRLEDEDGSYRFETVFGLGVKRLTGAEVAGIGGATRKKIRRSATRGFERLSDLKMNDISDVDRRKIDLERALLGAIESTASDKTARKTDAATVGKQTTVSDVFEGLRAL